jgi:type IV secretion system protein VirD4
MTVDEVLRLKGPVKDASGKIREPGEILVLVNGHPPIRGTQSLYFRDPTFVKRAALPPPTSITTPSEFHAAIEEFVL